MTVYVGLGANLGDGAATLDLAAQALAALPGTRLLALSPFFRSAPVDAGGPDFVNAVAALQTSLRPLPLLQALHGIEQRHGRERPYRNAPRTLDLDLLLYDNEVIDTPELVVPHPRLHQRAFVLLPLLALAPDLAHPALGRLQTWRERVGDQRIEPLPR